MVQPNYCRQCGRDLSDIEGQQKYSEECVGFVIKPIKKKRCFLTKTCTCGCCNKVDYDKRKNQVYLSAEVKALSVYLLNTIMCMPYNRIKSIFHDVIKLDISEGSIRNFIAEAGDNAQAICERIADELTKSPVARADESGFYVNGGAQMGLDITKSKAHTYMDSQRSRSKGDGRALWRRCPQGHRAGNRPP